MYTIRKQFRIEYSHQLDNAYSKACSDTIHGHSGVVELFIQSVDLLEDGMVVDFGKIKSMLNDCIMKYDHALIMPSSIALGKPDYIKELFLNNKNLIITDGNPTAENLSRIICEEVRVELDNSWENASQVHLTVRFHETTSGFAQYSE